MDFLDPRKRRAHNIRLMIGYFLMAIAIGLTSVILVYGAYGYGINTKTGAIIQNGLLFIDSKPAGAEIYLNGENRQTTTGARMTLPAGSYELLIKKAGYRDWTRKFDLNEHTIARYTYPFLFPLSPSPVNLKTYSQAPILITQSPDKRWLLTQVPSPGSGGMVFDMFDTTKLDQAPRQISLPAGMLDNPSISALKALEWSSDNNHLLLQANGPGGSEFIVLNRADPTLSINVNRLFNTSPAHVSLRDKKTDQLYIYNQADNSLSLGDVSRSALQPILINILAYKPVGANQLMYVTAQNVAAGQTMARIWENGKTYLLYTFSEGSKYLLDAREYKGHWYYVAGSDKADRINIYKDPLNGLRDPATAKAIPLIALPDFGVTKLSFSNNARFVAAQAGQKFAVYDIETQSRYQYEASLPLAGEMRWMDGHRLIGLSNGSVTVFDADSFNQQILAPADNGDFIFFDKSYNQMFTLSSEPGGVSLQRTDLRVGTDLPQ